MLLLKNITRLVTPTGKTAARGAQMNNVQVFTDAVVAVRDGKIFYAGEKKGFDKELFEAACVEDKTPYKEIDCAGKTVIPAFVDSHTHLVFGGYRAGEFALRQRGATYMEIMNSGGGIAASVEATRRATCDELVAAALDRIDELKKYGVTTVEIKSGYGLDKDNEIKQLRVIKKLKEICGIDVAATFMGAHSVPKEYKGRGGEYIDFIIRDVLPQIKKENLAEFVDIFCEKGVFSIEESEKLLTAAAAMGFRTKIHADEIVSLGGAELAAKTGCISAEHLLHISEQGVKDLAQSGTVATLLPLTAFCLSEPYAPARALIDGGAAVALATDFNPGSCFSSSIPLLIALSVIKMKMTINEVITALTLNGACALGLGDKAGTLEEGKAADLLILKYPSEDFLAYHTGVNCVEVTVKNGEII